MPIRNLKSHKNMKINLLIILSTLYSSVLYSQTIYVSPTGNDKNNGSQSSPVQSFQKGADLAKIEGAQRVEFAGGLYRFDATVVLDVSYSGIEFIAATGEKPIFTSLKQVLGWTTYSGNILRANSPLAAGTHIRYLQDQNENWMPRSETAVFKANETTFNPENSYHDPVVQLNKLNVQHPPGFGGTIDWGKATQYDLRASQTGWNQEILAIESYDFKQNRIFTKVPSNYEMRAHAKEEIWPNKNWVMNTITGIDQPGEWAIIDDTIYLWPISGTNDIYVPQLTELIRIDAGGDGNTWSDTPVQNIVFEGITMTGGDFYAYVDGDVATTHDWDVVDKPTALLRIRNAEDITIKNCTFSKSGGTAIRLDRYAQNITLINNTISYMGRSGIALIGRGPGYGDVNRDNTIVGNTITAIGREKWTAIAINLDQSSNNIVAKNYIEDTFFSAISITGPKQFVFMHHVIGTFEGDTWKGRDFHSHEFKPSVYNTIPMDPTSAFDIGTWDALDNIYSGNNVIENNAFINTNSGQGYLTQSVIYMSGITRHNSSFVRYNYFNETTEATTNSSVIWADSDQDNTDWIGNMVFNVDLVDDEPEQAVVYRSNTHCQGYDDDVLHDFGDRGLIKANVTLNSTYFQLTGFDVEDFRQLEGNVTNVDGGDNAHVNYYQTMWSAICPGIVAGKQLIGAQDFQEDLAEIIVNNGGIVPQCPLFPNELIFSSGFE